jgi:hypothetical protein
MSKDTIAILAALRADFEQLVALVTNPATESATLDQMERSIFRRVLRLGRQLLELFLATRVAHESHQPHRCEHDRVLPYHSQQPASYFSVFGKLTFRRAYFYRAGHSHCPLDTALSLPGRCYSDFLMELASLLAVDGVFEKSLAVLARLLALTLPKLALESWVRDASATVLPFYTQKVAFPAEEEGSILVAQADGKGVPMVRQETAPATVRRSKGDKKTRKKEAVATAVYTIAPYRRTPHDLIEALFPTRLAASASNRPSPCHKQVFASLNGKAWALRQLQARVQQRDGEHTHSGARVALTDGAAPLQQQMQAALPNFTLVLDLIHVAEHVWRAGTAVYGETDPQRALWVKTQLLDILSSRTEHVIRRLREKAGALRKSSQAQKVLRRVADYLDRNRPYMDYATYLKRGWPIGTGVIEGVCRHLVKDRMELSGMRWTVAGAEAVLALRAVHENGDWDTFHAFRRASDHEERYGGALPTAWVDQAERLEIKGF